MVDLGKLEQRLQVDQVYRNQFIKDPVGELAKLGITMSVDQARFLRESVDGRVNTMPARPRSGIIAILIGL